MSIAQVPQDRGVASPLMSNNPFRNKVVPPSAPAPIQPQAQSSRPVSTNPFLDISEYQKEPTNNVRPVPVNGAHEVADVFASMDLNGSSRMQPKVQQTSQSQSRSPERDPRLVSNGYGRSENVPQRPLRSPPLSHRPMLSEEDRQRQGNYQRRGTEMDIFADPPNAARSRERKSTRRNSESSVRDKPNLLDPEDAKRRQERKGRDPQSGKYRPSRRMDVIDKLDVTSIYGAGLFHHDGPFDACNPNRNKKRHRYAPIQAFPKDSANMQLGGGARPAKPQMDYAKYHGLGQEAHRDFNEAAVPDEDADYLRRPLPERSTSFNPVAFDAVHGQETAGLGTSTFLEGAPASRAAIQRRESEMNDVQPPVNGGGLSRKKSLAQKIRGARGGSNRVQSPEFDQGPASPLPTGKSDSFANPFFKDYDREYERKGQQIAQVEEQAGGGRARALSSPKLMPTLERQSTGGNAEPSQESKPSGFLGRMKSLKKTRSRAERRDAS